jgi:hypothetical protein
LSGYFNIWWSTKGWLFNRLSGVIQDTGISRPGTSATQSATSSLFDYWPSFLLLGLAGLLIVPFLYLYFRRGLRDGPAELLTAFIVGWYGSFAVIWRIGGVLNEQFFYFFMPLTITTVAYAVVAWPRMRAALPKRAGARSNEPKAGLPGANGQHEIAGSSGDALDRRGAVRP